MNPFVEDKVLDHLDRIVEWRDTGTCPPVGLEFYPTNRCNHNCPKCPRARKGYKDQSPKAHEFTFEQAQDIIAQFRRLGLRSVQFSGGGEPLLSPLTLPLIESLGLFPTGLVTNGSLLDATAADVAARNCAWVRVSLDAGTPEVYREMHGSFSDWDATLANLERVAGIKDRYANIGVSYLTGNSPDTDAEEAIRVVKNIGVDYIQFKPLRGSFLDMAYLIDRWRKTYEGDGFSIGWQPGSYGNMRPAQRNYALCHGQHFVAVVMASGDMYRCCEEPIKQMDEPFGNVLESSVASIWYSDKRKEQTLLHTNTCPELCDNCRHHGKNTLLERFVAKQPHSGFV